MGLLEHLPVISKNLLEDTPRPCAGCQHLRPPSEEVEVVVMLWLYHDSSTLSTPPQGGPESLRPHLHNYLQINGKKCIFLCYEHMCTLDKRRYNQQAKDADRLAPKGTGAGTES